MQILRGARLPRAQQHEHEEKRQCYAPRTSHCQNLAPPPPPCVSFFSLEVKVCALMAMYEYRTPRNRREYGQKSRGINSHWWWGCSTLYTVPLAVQRAG